MRERKREEEWERLDGRWRINEWVLARRSHDEVGGGSVGGWGGRALETGGAGFLFPSLLLIPGGFDGAAPLLLHQSCQVVKYKYSVQYSSVTVLEEIFQVSVLFFIFLLLLLPTFARQYLHFVPPTLEKQQAGY